MHLCHRFVGLSALLCLVFLLMPHAVLAARHQQRHATSRPAHHRREHHVRPHTARALRRARRHGTEAVRAAARSETQRVARGEDTDSSESASLNLPEEPLARMNLPPLRGSHESLVRQNERAEQDGLLRVKDDADLRTLRRQGSLVALPELASMRADSRLPANRRYCRVWTSQFLTDLARVHYQRFHKPLQINSAVRTIEYQRHLLHINGNAAPAEGDVASPHLTGEAVDIAKKGLTPSEVAWMRAYLLPLQTAGRIDVEEEFQQSCFHISVYKTYRTSRPEPAAPSKSSALVASGVR
ncbi:MAG: hypothetical protein QOK38_2836 [Acidobacteriaceae bacterium]|jgi:hypothetical protein|nr:hypothetical protein [Acidobacteriaceae bacterium]